MNCTRIANAVNSVQIIVDDAERADDGGREQIDERPHQNADGGSADDTAFIRAAHARDDAGTVVVAQSGWIAVATPMMGNTENCATRCTTPMDASAFSRPR